ncbi:zinc-dependent alcohol dehydrogenase family protein [Nisaea acidiphila]|uniref:enoyl-[acyl-carrier-protein] reductase n=1 Tax=Nisaea acidiphila TaxID=1862145 RepID=A0A9J7AUX3_9PROT|nr:zinc-dependent alcohol dehydrogenase family protein [Nisaea acidiphila]UUX51127.1 zinc-dependent alcohol dehydrogenase family protein [Nisaea acidiphila]
MKAAELTRVGPAEEVVVCKEVPGPSAPAKGEATIELIACSINPADILGIEGNYASIPETPSPLGIEGAGRVTAVGDGVKDLAAGDMVMSLHRANWAQSLTLPEAQLVKLPANIDPEQAAMMKVNAATALLMLQKYVKLKPGDWLMQNAANSGVGTDVIKLARRLDLHTVNVVRRQELIKPLHDMGANVVVLEGPDLAGRIASATNGAEIKLGLDAVAGNAVQTMAESLAPGGTIVNYGLLSGDPCVIAPHEVVFRDISLTGFWLAKLMRGMSKKKIQELYEELSGYFLDGTLKVAVEARYELDDIQKAMAHAKREGRGGKVLLRPNG